ncbi:hypothetical protein DCAR_0209762 [Daucus carota subsp. sativus]|uniref:Uncharacterized protein n=1 Tax=Daucus carota subsp. sativus TaxID=79200 RepID=A0A161ZGF8_DAUCS|nr:PREDICTED: uncharacterized protein LOC108210271 [Daucus carota subsp. sativus]WOG90518.1 hypothetical protein DCAR_0209762 [Daucus carota subsp. sativus]
MASIIQSPTISPVDRRRESPSNSAIIREAGTWKTRRAKSLICSKLKDVEAITVSELGDNLRLYGQFSSLVKETSEEEKEKQKYYVNMGDAIRTLREEFPHLFYRDLTYQIYRDDIVFKDPLNTFIGIDNYKSIFWALRFHGKVFFKALWVDIVSVWQPVESTIMIRWTVHGIPRVPWDSRGRFDGTSEYKLDKDGKIYEHRVHNIALNAPPRFRVFDVNDLLQSIGCPSTPKPTYYEIASLSSIKNIKLFEKESGSQHYLSSIFKDSGKAEAGISQSS